VGMTADVLFEKLRAKGFLTDEERATGTKAALIHDLTKREEIEFMKQRGDKDYPTQTEINERRREFFAQHGISEHDIQDYQLTQLASFDTLNIDPESIDVTTSPDTLREWTIFYADLSVAHTDLVGPHDRLEEIRQRDVYSQTYANKYREIFGEHEFRQLPNGTKDAAEIMMQRMEKQALTVADQLKKMLELPKDVDLHSYIIEQLKQRYAEHAT
ncbi:MAG: hypothetical protein HY976_02885, partial [Candidatus Kerfeldbacteria bacterium]|nr:hypothetical protein [Candidatus Kerfeldbacteria bacterium]